MKTIDIKSVIIGVMGSALFFLLMGSSIQSDNMGDIIANSLTIKKGGLVTIEDNEGEVGLALGDFEKVLGQGFAVILHNSELGNIVNLSSKGYLTINNDKTNTYLTIGLKDSLSPHIYLSAAGDKSLIYIGAKAGAGSITTYNNDGKEIVDISSTEGGNGRIAVYSSDGNELVSISSAGGQEGSISIFNRHNKEVIQLQSNKDADGAIYLSDRYGDLGWAESGKH